jgi:hypothetical protein
MEAGPAGPPSSTSGSEVGNDALSVIGGRVSVSVNSDDDPDSKELSSEYTHYHLYGHIVAYLPPDDEEPMALYKVIVDVPRNRARYQTLDNCSSSLTAADVLSDVRLRLQRGDSLGVMSANAEQGDGEENMIVWFEDYEPHELLLID